MSNWFGCFGCLSTQSSSDDLQISIAAKTLVESYPNDLDNSFIDELYQFAKFADIIKDEEPGDISTERYLYKLIIGKGMLDTFPHVAVALSIYLIFTVTNCIVLNVRFLNSS